MKAALLLACMAMTSAGQQAGNGGEGGQASQGGTSGNVTVVSAGGSSSRGPPGGPDSQPVTVAASSRGPEPVSGSTLGSQTGWQASQGGTSGNVTVVSAGGSSSRGPPPVSDGSRPVTVESSSGGGDTESNAGEGGQGSSPSAEIDTAGGGGPSSRGLTSSDEGRQPSSAADEEEEDLDQLVDETIEQFNSMDPEELKQALAEFAASEEFTVDFGFQENGEDPTCERQVPKGDVSCPNYVGLNTITQEDDIEATLLLIESTCTSENATPPNALGPFLCLGAVGSCRASSLGWKLPANNTKNSLGEFFSNIKLGEMTKIGDQEKRPTLCYRDCRAAWEFWAGCGNFALDGEKDPCEGLPETDCFDPSRPETAQLKAASEKLVPAAMATIMTVLLFAL